MHAAPRIPLLVLEIAFVLCWSSGYVTAEFALAGSAPFTVLFVRYIAAAGLLLGWIALRRQRVPRDLRLLGRIAISGILSNAVWPAALYIALYLGVTSGTGALLTSLQPMGTALLGLALFGRRLAIRQAIGLGLGLVGVYLVVAEDVALLSAPPWAYALPIVSVTAIAWSYVLEERGPHDPAERKPLAVLLLVQFAASAVVLTPFAVAEGFPLDPDPVVLLAFGWQIVGLSIAS
ncbi:DMT family transporter [Jannaschia sp. S6380]|uniref:DMT family transporter n=1 Tax=Jannaschia sp. S6380 TaxID=2926408 RepID=UPI001FF10466|nr:DMT family transporter [Jannaschia sp. S6380]MCK0168596.1 DMT family transporter [Jannaschia sp. S6380]